MPTEEIISRPEELAAFCEHLAACPAFGFDTEFIGEETFVPELCLVQVATPERLALIDPLATGPLDAFWAVVVRPEHTAIVHACREEIRLCQRSCGRTPGRLFDLQIAAGLAGLPFPLGHGPLLNQVLGVKLHKGETLTDWKKRPLTEEQTRYAFDDVRYLLPAWEILAKRLRESGRRAWADEENAALIRRSLGDEPGVERWRRLSGLGSMDRKKLAVVRALVSWREDKATRQNRPVRSVLRDDLIVEIARRSPKSEHDLAVVRGVAKKHVSEMLQVVASARSLPAEELPDFVQREDDPPQCQLIAGLLNAVLGNLCAQLGLAQSLVASASDVKQLVRSTQRGEALPETNPLATGWRAQAILPELSAVLHGQRALRVADMNRAVPLAIESL